MRSRVTIFILSFVIIFAMANNSVSFSGFSKNDTDTTVSENTHDSARVDSVIPKNAVDTAFSQAIDTLDSLHRAIFLRNQAIDDSIRLDSLNRRKKNGIDAPVSYTADDSLVYFAGNKMAHLYGSSTVKYENMDLASEKVAITLDSSLVRATGVLDTSTHEKIGTPVFKMGSDTYESDTMAFNFKTKKGLISSVYTEQEDGFLTAERSKRDREGNLYLKHGRYTTCDEEHPDFYLALSRAKVRPGKDVIFGPAYLVVQDVPLPIAIPYGFFPFSKSYSSGFIMPTYGDETSRGFYLRDGGYYFAISDRMDLKLTGEIYTKGSWGISASSNYRKRYKYSGSFNLSFQDTRTGDKGMPDYSSDKSFRIGWSHSQDAKSNPFSRLSASVNFSTSNYEQNNLTSFYNPQSRSQTTRTSSVSWNTSFSSIGLSLSSTANISQDMRDSTLSLTLPDLNISISRFNPFKRKYSAGKERWYEKISMSYTGHVSNSITTKENEFKNASLSKDWKNGMEHSIPVSASFSILNVINVSPSVNLTDRMYAKKVEKSWDVDKHGNSYERLDTISGFYNVFNWNASVSANTKVYGFFVPNRKIFGDKIQAIRHVFTPSVSYTYTPDFGNSKYGYWKSYYKPRGGMIDTVYYSPFDNALFGVPGRGESQSISMSVSNNIEMKVKSDKDTTGYRKISIIDELGASMSYNMAAKERPWSDLSMNIRLKWWKNYTFTLNARFATYALEYTKDSEGNYNIFQSKHTEYSFGRFGRFQGMSQNISYTLNPEKLRKLFGKDDDKKKNDSDEDSDDDFDTGLDTNVDPVMMKGQRGAEGKSRAETDDDGYMQFTMPWSITFSYGVTMSENVSPSAFVEHSDGKTGHYKYKLTHTLNFSGNVRLSDGWDISWSSGYDFNYHKLSTTTASLSRDLHCFSMSCGVVIAPYTSYNFSFRCKAATLTDALKYDKRSGMSNNVKWY